METRKLPGDGLGLRSLVRLAIVLLLVFWTMGWIVSQSFAENNPSCPSVQIRVQSTASVHITPRSAMACLRTIDWQILYFRVIGLGLGTVMAIAVLTFFLFAEMILITWPPKKDHRSSQYDLSRLL